MTLDLAHILLYGGLIGVGVFILTAIILAAVIPHSRKKLIKKLEGRYE